MPTRTIVLDPDPDSDGAVTATIRVDGAKPIQFTGPAATVAVLVQAQVPQLLGTTAEALPVAS